MAALGELKAPWHDCQMTWLDNHLNLINAYSQALENLDSYEGLFIDSLELLKNLLQKVMFFWPGPSLRKSSQKGEKKYEFVPTNLHLQRMYVENDSLRKTGTYDIVTHGAFTSYGRKSQGLIK